MKKTIKLVLLVTIFLIGSAFPASLWVGGCSPPCGSGCSATNAAARISEIYFADQNTIQFAVKAGTQTGEGCYIYVKTNDNVITVGTDSANVRKFFTLSALDVGHGAFMALHAQMLKAMELGYRVGFGYQSTNNPTHKVYNLTIYRD
jgi:hypothetical protein